MRGRPGRIYGLALEPQSPGRMRVGFDARWYNDSGVGSYVCGLLGALAQLKHEIELVVYEDMANPVPLPGNAKVERIPLGAAKYSVAEQFVLARRCREDRLDVFHSPFYVVPVFAACPVVVTIHDLIPFFFPVYRWPKSAMVRSGYRMAAHKGHQIIADSHNTARDVTSSLRIETDRISVVHLAAQECYHPVGEQGELELITAKYGVRPPYAIASSARNWRTKNVLTALQALEVARQLSGVEFETLIYGSPEGFRTAGGEQRWRSLNVKVAGYLPSDELARLFRHATVFVMASVYEGFGLPVLEAMSCGCAVVCSTGGALAEVAANGAQVFDPFDVEGMAMAVSALLRDEGKLNFWKQAALRRSREFSWAKAARETISVYHRTRSGMSFHSAGTEG